MLKNLYSVYYISLAVLLLHVMPAAAESIELPSGQEIMVKEYGDRDAKRHILWLHSERGLTPDLGELAQWVSLDYHIIMPDFHGSYFLSGTRDSLNKIPIDDFEHIVEYYAKLYARNKHAKSDLYIISNSRSSEKALVSTNALQQKGYEFSGLILVSPHLRKAVPVIGEDAQYLDVVNYSNLPIYLIQPERSPRYIPVKALVEKLQQAGSPVFLHVLKNVGGGYQIAPETRRLEADEKAREQFAGHLDNAMMLLDSSKPGALKPFSPVQAAAKKHKRKVGIERLVKTSMPTPALKLPDLQGKEISLEDYKGKKVIVSFWASWCGPCLEEIPSLVGLKARHKDTLEVLAVNILEDKATINKFTREMNINFPILQDLKSDTVSNWKVYVYPSNYLVDTTGKLQYAATGALDWQEENIQKLIESLP